MVAKTWRHPLFLQLFKLPIDLIVSPRGTTGPTAFR